MVEYLHTGRDSDDVSIAIIGRVRIMRVIILIISSLLLVAFFGIKSYSIDWSNPEYYQSIDDLISSGNGYDFVPLSEQAQASRSDQAGQPEKDILSLPSPAIR